MAYAIGIGAATLAFTIFDSVLLRPFPFHRPDRLVFVWGKDPKTNARLMVSLPNFQDIRGRAEEVFSHTAAALPVTFDSTDGAYPERFPGRRATADFFSTLGVQPRLGRSFSPGERNVILLSHSLWRSRFASDPGVLGRTLQLRANDLAPEIHTIIGVLPPSIESAYPRHADIWAPIDEAGAEFADRRMGAFSVIARLRDGIAVNTAQTAVNTLAAALAAEYPEANRQNGIEILPIHESLTTAPAAVFPAIAAAVAFLLALACANIVHLSLARGQDRIREFKVRASLGASPGRLLRHLLTESVLLSCSGGALGAALAWFVLEAVKPLIPAGFLRAESVAIDLRVLAAVTALAIAAGVVTGLWPALRLSTLSFTGRRRSHSFLVVAEIAAGLVLLSGAALSVTSLIRLLRVDTGFDTTGLVALQTHLPRASYGEPARRAAAAADLLRQVTATPGVASAAISDFRPLGNTMNVLVQRPGQSGVEAATTESIAGEYLEVMRIPLLAGRSFNSADGSGGEKVAIVSQRAAQTLWPEEQPLGKEFKTMGRSPVVYRVVGIAGDVRRAGPQREAASHFYKPVAQDPPYLVEILVRTQPNLDAATLLHPLRTAVASVDKSLAIHEAVVMSNTVRNLLQRPRLLATLLGGFGVFALILTALGIYGTTSYAVAQRRHEIGVRLALGATAAQVRQLFVRRGAGFACLGLAIGAGGVWGIGRLLAGMLYGVQPLDVPANLAAAAVLLLTAIAANAIPARRAARIDPAVTLRAE
jgi:predicted permease